MRIFTPEYEVPFAGHPTLGLAFVAASLGLAREDGSITLRLNPAQHEGKQVDVAVKRGPDGVWWMEQMAPTFVDPLPVAQLAALLPNWESVVDETALLAGALVPEVSTGLPYLLIPVKGAEALAAVATPSGGLEKLTAIERSAETHPLKLHSSLYFYYLAAGAAEGAAAMYCKWQHKCHFFVFCSCFWPTIRWVTRDLGRIPLSRASISILSF